MNITSRALLHVAIGATGASALIITFSHLFWMVPLWASPSPATTSAGEFGKYFGMLLAAVVAAGVGFNAWLASFYKRRREGRSDIRPLLTRLPLLLLLPCLVHYFGFQQYSYREIARNQAVVNQYRLHKK